VGPAPEAAGTWIRVKVVPGASKDALAGRQADRWKVRVAQPPERGRANRAVEALLAALLGVSPGRVKVVRGARSALKTVAVAGMAPAEVARRLAEEVE
jgi:uncharacterized protein